MEPETFPGTHESRIRSLLREKVKAPRERQKRIRDELRCELGFYINHFRRSSLPFTEADLDEQVALGRVVFNR